MKIVHATSNDTAEIIDLMRMSLGEALMPKSERFFKWKHEENPFGRSIMLLAKEEGKLVGFRSFMRWEWALGNESVKAVRAVDTATHPDFQGRGIFKKLTMQAIAEAEKEGIGMVFNTPNPISKIGYMKMGWQSAGRMPLWFGPGFLFPARFSGTDDIPAEFKLSEKLNELEDDFSKSSGIDYFHTPLSRNYLKWRYADCPVAKYVMLSEKDSFGIIFRLKPLGVFTELRVCELWCKEGINNDKKLNQGLKTLKRKFRPLVVSCGPGAAVTKLSMVFGPFSKGPEVTIRPMLIKDLSSFNHYTLWKPSIGSLELF